MAALFAVGLPFTYDGTTNHFATTTGGSATVAAVTSADTVTIDGSSGSGTLTIGAAWSCTSLVIASTASGVTVLCDATHSITTTGVVTHNAGTLNTNGLACSWGTYSSSGSTTRVLTITNSTITITGGAGTTAWDTAAGTNMTLNSAGSTVLFTAASPQMRATGGVGKTYNNLTFNGGGATGGIGNIITLNGRLTVTTTATKTCAFFITTGSTLVDLTLTGNSALNRLRFTSCNSSGNGQGIGSQATITVTNAPTISNVVFTDIKAAGTGGTWAGTTMGDGGGNSNITFDSPLTLYRVGTGANWSASAFALSANGVTGQRVPLPQDTVFVDGNNSGTITMDMPDATGSIDFTNFAGTLSFASVAVVIYGSLKLSTTMTLTGTFVSSFAGRGSYTIDCATKSLTNGWTIAAPTGTYTLTSKYAQSAAAASFSLNFGTFDASTFDVQVAQFSSSNSNLRTLHMGTGNTWTLFNVTAAATVWNVATTTNLTFDAGTSTLTHNGTTSSVITLFWNLGSISLSYNNISLSTAQQTITHSFSNGATIGGTYTQIAGNVSSWSTSPVVFNNAPVISGTAGNLVTITGSQGAANPAHWRVGASSVTPYSADYLSLTDHHGDTNAGALGTGLWYAGIHSVDGGDNTGWIFTAPPKGSGNLLMMGIG